MKQKKESWWGIQVHHFPTNWNFRMEQILKCAKLFFFYTWYPWKNHYTGWTKPPSTITNKWQTRQLHLDLRVAKMQSWKLLLQNSLRTGYRICSLLIHTTAYKDKKFLHPGTTISQLHREYQQAAATAEVDALPIKERFQDLPSMKYVMPVECHQFFDNMPHNYTNTHQDDWERFRGETDLNGKGSQLKTQQRRAGGSSEERHMPPQGLIYLPFVLFS